MVESRNLQKHYAGKPAIHNLSFRLEKGHIYGLLGPNGSGKSTWMKMVAGLIAPEFGEVLVDDQKIGPATKKKVAYVSTEPFFYPYMTVKNVGKYFEDFFEDFDPARFEKLIPEMGLDMNMKVRALSSGMAAKLKIAVTMSRQAEVFLLDEPFNGIDLLARDEIVNTILDSFTEDCIIVISSHMVEELEKIIDSVVFLRDGQLALEGDVEDLRANHGKSVADLYRNIFGNPQGFGL